MDSLPVSFVAAISLFPYFLFGLAFFVLGKFVFDWSTPRIDDEKELSERDNPAFALIFLGYMLGLAFALAGSLSSLGPDPLTNLIDIAVSGLGAIILLRLGMILGERLVLPGISFSREIVEDRNLGAGFAFAGLFLANGLVIGGVMAGRSDTWQDMLIDIGLYWLLGQAFLLIAWYLFRLIARFDLRKEIAEKNSAAAGLGLGGFFAGIGIILEVALRGAGSDRLAETLTASAVGLVGLLILSGARLLSSTILFRRGKAAGMSDSKAAGTSDSIAAGAVSALASLATAVLYAALIGSQLG
ncbi:MAG: DUF350 domain-containing protein [Spirochaetota bacterium]